MKNHIAFKFLAILLCAACLLGAVGSGAAMLVLTELDGYNSSVPERYADLLENESLRYAQTRLVRYVESSQPGFPTAIDYSDDGTLHTYNPFPVNTSGYEILDGEGNVVEDKTGAPLANPVTYTFPAEGTYRKVVSIEPYEEPEEETVNYTVLVNKLPPTGTVEVCGLSLEYAGSSSGMYGETPIAYAMVKADGGIRVIFFDDGNVEDMWQPDTLLGITLYDRNNEILYVAHGDDGVGEFSRDQNDDLAAFESFATTEEPDEKPARTGTVDGYVNVYSAPSLDSGVLGSLGTGFPVEITATTNVAGVEWGYVPDMGWLRMNQVTLADDSGPDTPFAQAETEPTATGPFTGITTSRATGYAIPDTKADVVGTCDKDCMLEVYQQTMVKDTLWFYTDSGWIPGKAITLTQAPEGMDESALSTATLAITTEEVPVYGAPNREKPATSSLNANTTLALTRQIDVEGETWGYLVGGGWVSLGNVTLLETSLPVLAQNAEPVETIPEETVPATQSPEETIEETEVFSEIYWDSAAQQTMQLNYTLEPLPDYTLVLYLEADVRTYYPEYDVMMLLWSCQDSLVKLLGVCLLLFAVLAVYLCCAAGRKPGSGEIHPAAFNALPLDLYLVGGCLAGFGLGALGVLGVEELLEHDWQVACGLGMGMGYGICLIFVGFCFACAAQFKTPGGYWWRNTLCVRVARLCWWLCRWFWRKCVKAIPWLGSVIVWCFGLVKKVFSWCFNLIKRLLGWIWRGIERFVALLPLTWQWLMAGAAMFLLLLMVQVTRSNFLTLLCLAGCVGIILYGAHCFGILAESAKRMSKGDLDIQVEDPWMLGAFQTFAQDLNALAGVAVVAAQKQLKSERMKTELITNVSHDIKTPLTSIINYVDLLQKPHTQQEGKQYLEVLDRQSQRLKKLIEDLMEMSKASTGNMTVDIKPLDGEEAVNQALGEFADKLAAAQLVPVFRRPEKPVTLLADGRLLWRVLSNLLSNAVKYALPGTRLYIDLMALEGKAILSLKNISREELNMEADELMERFVRGDSSRNTEGSGLGLNIAKSLMELQKGSLQLLVDGDLFKVTLIFPLA